MKNTQPVIRLETQIAVTRYGARYWAVYLNGQLLAVTVYKKGALAIRHALVYAPLETVGIPQTSTPAADLI